MRAILAIVLLLASLAPARAQPVTEAQVRDRLLLRHEPPGLDAWAEAGEPARSILLAIARDPAERAQPRARAIQALGAFEDAEVAAALREIAEDGGERLIFRAIAVEALGDSQGDAALDAVARAADSARAPLRESAVRALGKMRSAEAKAVLSRLTADRAPEVRASAEKALAR